MSENDIGRLIFLTILGAGLAGWFIASNRRSQGRMVQYEMLWGLIFIGIIGAVGLWGDIRDDVLPRQQIVGDGSRVEVPRARDGHYYLTLGINGEPVHFTVDTGATGIVLSRADARRAGIDPDMLAYLGEALTANGVVRTARVWLDEIRLGAIADRNVSAYVNEAEMEGSLLGMDYLGRFERIEIADGTLILQR